MAYQLPPISAVNNNTLPESQQKQIIDHLFEHSTTLYEFLIPKLFSPTSSSLSSSSTTTTTTSSSPSTSKTISSSLSTSPSEHKSSKKAYSSYRDLIEHARLELLWLLSTAESSSSKAASFSSSVDPRISQIIGAHPRLGASPKKILTLSEHSQQEQSSLQRATENEKVKLRQLNDLYEKKFPGLRYVVFVNGRPREEIMRDMELRINRGDIVAERKAAFNAMCDIALDRATKLEAMQKL